MKQLHIQAENIKLHPVSFQLCFAFCTTCPYVEYVGEKLKIKLQWPLSHSGTF